jgi:hypothetical protein
MPLTTRKGPPMTTTAQPQSVARPAHALAEPTRFGPARLVADARTCPDHRARSTIEGTL